MISLYSKIKITIRRFWYVLLCCFTTILKNIQIYYLLMLGDLHLKKKVKYLFSPWIVLYRSFSHFIWTLCVFIQMVKLYLLLLGVILLLLKQGMVISYNLIISFVIFNKLLVNKWKKNLNEKYLYSEKHIDITYNFILE